MYNPSYSKFSSRKHKKISLEEIADILDVSLMDSKSLFEEIQYLVEKDILEPNKSSGTNGNRIYPLFKEYRIITKKEVIDDRYIKEISNLHPLLLKNDYLKKHPDKYIKNRRYINMLNRYVFRGLPKTAISRKERSYEIFNNEKVLSQNKGMISIIEHIDIKPLLRFYDTPEYCFNDYIPERKDFLTLLVCENKDIWFNIRKKMYEEGMKSIFGTEIDGVVFGNGNTISQKKNSFTEYTKFLGCRRVSILYWGDIDREGISIYSRFKAINPTIHITPFIPGYIKMLEYAKLREEQEMSHSNRSIEVDYTEFNELGTELFDFFHDVLEKNQQIPQEIISFDKLEE